MDIKNKTTWLKLFLMSYCCLKNKKEDYTKTNIYINFTPKKYFSSFDSKKINKKCLSVFPQKYDLVILVGRTNKSF